MMLLGIAPNRVDGHARQVRASAPAPLCIFGLGLALCILLPIPMRGQAAIATRGHGPRATLDQSTIMTKVKTSRLSRERPPRTATATNDIRPFRVHMSDSALADLRR